MFPPRHDARVLSITTPVKKSDRAIAARGQKQGTIYATNKGKVSVETRFAD
jgi:hypothetical protein